MSINRLQKKNEVIEYINTELKGYQGYVQFSHRPIDIDKDLFFDGDHVSIEDEKGFVFEAHFYNGVESISIKQQNTEWAITKTDIPVDSDMETYRTIGSFDINMAQIWKEVPDSYCADMLVKKLDSVVFAGFNRGGEA